MILFLVISSLYNKLKVAESSQQQAVITADCILATVD